MSQLDTIVERYCDDYKISHGEDEVNVRVLAKQQVKDLILALLGNMEQRETEDMSLASWSKDDYKAFGRNELRGELIKKVNEL